MTIAANDNPRTYPGNAVATVFTGPKLISSAHLVVTEVSAAGVETSPPYTVSGVGLPTSTVTMTTAPAVGQTLILRRTVPIEQTTDITNQQTLQRRVLEDALDYGVMMIQQTAEALGRTLQFSPNTLGYSGILPTPVVGATLVWGASGLSNGSTTLTGDMALRGELAANVSGKGAEYVTYYDQVSPAYLKTTSDIINGERVSVLRGITKSLHAGIRAGSDTANHAAAINALLVAMGSTKYGDLFVPRGTYNSTQLTVPSGVNITGETGSTIKAHSSLATNAPLLINSVITGAVNTVSDVDITVTNLLFDASALAADRTVEFLSFIKAGRVVLDRVRVAGPRYMGVAFGGCKLVRVLNYSATGTGKVAVTAEGGPALWIGNAGDGSTCDDVFIINPHIYSCEWAGIYTTGTRVTIRDPHILSVKEAGIFGTANGLEILGGFIGSTTKKNISASGIELGGLNINIGAGLIISDSNNCSIALTDTQDVMIAGVKSRNARRDAATFPTAGHYVVLSQQASPNMPRDITMVGNSAADYSSPATAAVRIEGSGAGAAMINVKVCDNNFTGTAWTTGNAIYVNPTYWTNANCEHSGNVGADDTAPAVRATRNTTQSLTSGVAANITFDAAAQNSYTMWVVGSATRITIPVGVKRVVVNGQVTFAGNATGIRQAEIFYNGNAGYPGAGRAIVTNAGAGYSQPVNVSTGILDVVPGDYFELNALQDSGGALNTVAGTAYTWLSVSVLQ